MKIIKKIFTVLLISVFVIVFPFSMSVKAADINAAVRTGDKGIIGIVIAVVAFIITAFVTNRLTKNNNKKIK